MTKASAPMICLRFCKPRILIYSYLKQVIYTNLIFSFFLKRYSNDSQTALSHNATINLAARESHQNYKSKPSYFLQSILQILSVNDFFYYVNLFLSGLSFNINGNGAQTIN